jgi:cytoskeleton protein RodZ
MVKDHTGTVLLNRVIKAGETWSVPPRAGLRLTVGDAGGTDIVVDSATTPSLSGTGVVRRDLPLDPDRIKGGKLSSTVMAPLVSIRSRQ